MKRREFISLLSSAATWPLAARAQQPDRMRRIGVLMHLAADDPEGNMKTAKALGVTFPITLLGRADEVIE